MGGGDWRRGDGRRCVRGRRLANRALGRAESSGNVERSLGDPTAHEGKMVCRLVGAISGGGHESSAGAVSVCMAVSMWMSQNVGMGVRVSVTGMAGWVGGCGAGVGGRVGRWEAVADMRWYLGRETRMAGG